MNQPTHHTIHPTTLTPVNSLSLRRMKAIEDRREKKALLAAVTELRPDEDLKFEALGSFTRPTSPESFSPASTSIWRPLTSHDLAIEFKRRCVVLTKMRTAAKQGHIPPTSSRPSSPRLQAQQLFGMSPTEAGKTKLRVPEPDELTQNMWTCYLMLLENGQSRASGKPGLETQPADQSCLQTVETFVTWSSTRACVHT